jgi:hypothetical protein
VLFASAGRDNVVSCWWLDVLVFVFGRVFGVVMVELFDNAIFNGWAFMMLSSRFSGPGLVKVRIVCK